MDAGCKRGGLEVHLRGWLCGLVFYIIKYSVFDIGEIDKNIFYDMYNVKKIYYLINYLFILIF